MSNVVGLRGEEIRPPGEVNPDVVAQAEKILEMAKSGEINALVAAWLHADETVGGARKGGSNYRLLGLLTHLSHDICADLGA
jgi:hypothetical protein